MKHELYGSRYVPHQSTRTSRRPTAYQGYQNAMPSAQTALPVLAYVPPQPFESLYTPHEGLCAGTLFPSLHKPFLGGECS